MQPPTPEKFPGRGDPGQTPEGVDSVVGSESTPPALLDAALAYAAAGWHVFPLRGNTPLRGSNGFYDATTDLDQVRRWWTGRPDCNIGTGIPESLAAVDVDAKHGGLLTLQEFEETYGVPETLSVLTGGGGLHLYFLHPGGELRQGVGILGAGIDTRIPGKGYTILPPSKHRSGRDYEWYDETIPPAPMPRWMVDRLRPEPQQKPRSAASDALDGFTGGVDARLRGVLSVVGPEGPGWNDRLHWAACRAGEMVRDQGQDPDQLVRLLLEAAQPWNGREARAAEATIKSGMRRTGGVAA